LGLRIVFPCDATGISSFGLHALDDGGANTGFEFVAFEPGVHLLHLKLAEFMILDGGDLFDSLHNHGGWLFREGSSAPIHTHPWQKRSDASLKDS